MRQSTTLLAAILLATSPYVAIQSASAAPLSTDRTLSKIGRTLRQSNIAIMAGIMERFRDTGGTAITVDMAAIPAAISVTAQLCSVA